MKNPVHASAFSLRWKEGKKVFASFSTAAGDHFVNNYFGSKTNGEASIVSNAKQINSKNEQANTARSQKNVQECMVMCLTHICTVMLWLVLRVWTDGQGSSWLLFSWGIPPIQSCDFASSLPLLQREQLSAGFPGLREPPALTGNSLVALVRCCSAARAWCCMMPHIGCWMLLFSRLDITVTYCEWQCILPLPLSSEFKVLAPAKFAIFERTRKMFMICAFGHILAVIYINTCIFSEDFTLKE